MPNYKQAARNIAREHGVNPEIFVKQIGAESSWRPDAVSSAGALGLGQLMPGTARGLGVDPHDPMDNLRGAAKYMRQQLDSFGGDYRMALAAYNAGPGAAQKALDSYPETQDYVKKILGASNPTAGKRSAGGGGIAPSSPANGLSDSALRMIFDKPEHGNFLDTLLAVRASNASTPHYEDDGHDHSESSTGGAPVPGQRKGEAGWQYLQRIAQKKFGLQNDPGTSQTTGGRHTAGSEHYSNRAIDFGDARNSRADLNAWFKWAKQQGYDALDEGDHIHVSLPGSGI